MWRWMIGMLGCGGPSEQTCTTIHAWVAQLHLPEGTHPNLALPPTLASTTADGRVSVSVSASRTCLLLKHSVGYKGNWHGTAWCTAPVADSELMSWEGRLSVPLGTPPMEELFVRRRRAPHRLDVYFDLN